jgi:hypothetical protein
MLRKLYPLFSLFMILVLVGCTMPAEPAPTNATVQPISTEVAQIVGLTQTALAVQTTVTAIAQITQLPTDLATATAQPVPPTATLPPAQTPASATLTPTTVPLATATPTLTPQPADCTNQMGWVGETVEDGTEFTPNQPFTKTWTLKNTGTCTWTTAYAIAFDSGDQMGALAATPLTKEVPPNADAVLAVKLVSPQATGVYEGKFKLRTASGALFGLGASNATPFTVKITVIDKSEPNFGGATWTDTFDAESGYWRMGADADTKYELSGGALLITALTSSGDQWRVSGWPAVKDLYVAANFKTGAACSGKDSYGLIARTFDSGNDGSYDSGILFDLACDGNYRLYRLDNNNFVNLVNWTASTAIHAGPNQANRMGLLIQGDVITLYINGQKVNQVSGAQDEAGQFGLVIRSTNTTNLQVYVEDLSYWKLDK